MNRWIELVMTQMLPWPIGVLVSASALSLVIGLIGLWSLWRARRLLTGLSTSTVLVWGGLGPDGARPAALGAAGAARAWADLGADPARAFAALRLPPPKDQQPEQLPYKFFVAQLLTRSSAFSILSIKLATLKRK